MTTSTNANARMATPHDLEGTLRTLADDGLVLMPTDTLWSIGCDATNRLSLRRLFRLIAASDGSRIEILVDSIPMLKKYVRRLHPRLETLLLYHVRPLTVLLPGAVNLPPEVQRPDGLTAFRIAQDEYSRQLLHAYCSPLATAFATAGEAPPPATFGEIRSDIIQGVDHVVRRGQLEKRPGEPSVMVLLSERAELVFLRD